MKQQHESNLWDPKERFAWALRGVKVNGIPVAVPEPVLEGWSEHLSKAGCLHIDQVKEVLSQFSNGDEILAKLPKQEIHYQPPIRGQDHSFNSSGEWKSVSEPIEQPMVPTASKMTDQEKAKMIQEFREEGLID